ncbi:MAG: OmpA family protein [Sulfuricurvum sp.]|nr:OmpA family protein [Sulfuricurvum sp.]
MQRKLAIGLLCLGLAWSHVSADVSEMIFYPQADFSEGILHFNYQGAKNRNYAFMFDRGFDPSRIVYVRPDDHTTEKLKDGTVKLSFANTDRYSYVQRAFRDDFLVSEENGIYKILLSGGDCKGSPDCVTAENILTVNVPKGYGVRSYQGLDQDLKPLSDPQWQQKGNTFTLTARDVKGACIMMEIEKLKPGQTMAPIVISEPLQRSKPTEPVGRIADLFNAPTVSKPLKGVSAEAAPVTVAAVETVQSVTPPPVLRPKPIADKPVAEKSSLDHPVPLKPVIEIPAVVQPVSLKPIVEKPVVEKPVAEKPAVALSTPLPVAYFRNFQLFNSRIVALNEAGKVRLQEWAKLYKMSGKRSIIINAYTDDIPPQRLKHLYATNEIISEARGKLVAEYLVSQGIDPKAITVNGMGDADPIASNETEEGRSKNRRVEFILN